MTNNQYYFEAQQYVDKYHLAEKYQTQLQELITQDFSVTNLEIDARLPHIPVESGFIHLELIARSVRELISFNVALGLYPVVYEGENDGQLIRNVCPKKSTQFHISSHGSSLDFFPHVDNPDLPIVGEIASSKIGRCPDTLTLLSLRSQDNVFTSLLLLDDILENLSDDDIKLLSQPLFKVKRPDSFEKDNISINNLPLLTKHNGRYYSRFDYHNISTTDSLCLKALNKFREISLNERLWKRFNLKPGELIIFNNQRTLHTRNKFTPKFNGNDRWLLRLFGLRERPSENSLVSYNCNHHLKTKLN